MTIEELAKAEEKIKKAFRDGQIVGMSTAGWPPSLIAAELEMNVSTVRSVIRKYKK